MSRVLIVEDEPALADSVRYGLEREGFEATVLPDGSRAVEYVRSWRPDLVLLDLMLPGMPGADVCREIRRIGGVPIVMVTAKDSEADKVLGLELGADDYITKPFSMRELIARVRAVLRRAGVASPIEEKPLALSAGPVEMDTDRHEVRHRNKGLVIRPSVRRGAASPRRRPCRGSCRRGSRYRGSCGRYPAGGEPKPAAPA